MRHKVLSIMLAVLMSMAASVVSAYDACIDGIYYNFAVSYAMVTYKSTSYNSYSGSVVIPEAVTYRNNTYSVAKIGERAFDTCTGLTSVVIGSNVKEISDYAFNYCSSLMSVLIPSTTTSIGQDAFTGCSSMTEIIVDSNNPVYDSRNNCNAIIETSTNTLVTGCKGTIIPEDVTAIGFAAFSGCKELVSIEIPESVTTIGRWAFVGCSSLEHISIPNNVTSIANDAFQSSGLKSITIGRSVKSIEASAFRACTNLAEVYVLGNSPATLTQYTFDSSHYTKATLYVPAGCKTTYKNANYWKNFNNIQEYASNISLTDGTIYTNETNTGYDKITYTRTFANTEWQALYVPFEMAYEDWAEDFEVARLNNVNQYDDNDDGEVDRTVLEVFKVKNGTIKANTPYLIKAKTTGQKTITMTYTTLYKAEENSIDCSSVGTLYTFTGTYTGIDGATMVRNGYYAVNGGSLRKADDSSYGLSPMRWYMTATDRNGNAQELGEVKIVVFGEEETGVISIENGQLTMDNGGPVYDMSGRRINANEKFKKGVYIVRMSDGTTRKVMNTHRR